MWRGRFVATISFLPTPVRGRGPAGQVQVLGGGAPLAKCKSWGRGPAGQVQVLGGGAPAGCETLVGTDYGAPVSGSEPNASGHSSKGLTHPRMLEQHPSRLSLFHAGVLPLWLGSCLRDPSSSEPDWALAWRSARCVTGASLLLRR